MTAPLLFKNLKLLDPAFSEPREGYEVLVQARVPANDGGLSLGQAAIAAVQATGG